jgi:glycerol dehydrogenase
MIAMTTTRAFGSPLKYIQGPGEFENLESYTRTLGKRVLITIDGFLFDSLSARLESIYASSGGSFAGSSVSEYRALKFGGECCEEECNKLRKPWITRPMFWSRQEAEKPWIR